MLGLRPMEIALIVFALLLLFGASRLPQLGSSLGSAIRNFKKSFSDDGSEGDVSMKEKQLLQEGKKDVSLEDKTSSK